MGTRTQRPSAYFGKYVFNREKMYQYLPIDVYEKLCHVIDDGERLDRSIADAVAEGMKQWAMDMGGNTLHTLVSTLNRRYGRET